MPGPKIDWDIPGTSPLKSGLGKGYAPGRRTKANTKANRAGLEGRVLSGGTEWRDGRESNPQLLA